MATVVVWSSARSGFFPVPPRLRPPSKTTTRPSGRSHRSGYGHRPSFGGPNSPEGQLEEDDRVTKSKFQFYLPLFDREMQPWFDWKKQLSERHGIEFTGHYVTLYQTLSDSLEDPRDAWSGFLRTTFKWTLLGRGTKDTGSIVVMVDHRHRYLDIAPADLAGQAGYLGNYRDLDG